MMIIITVIRAVQFLNNLCHKITSVSADDKEGQFLSLHTTLSLCRDLTPYLAT